MEAGLSEFRSHASSEEADLLDLYRRAFDDPAFHRGLAHPGAAPRPLHPWQAWIVRQVEAMMVDGTGETMTVRICRQAGKNECAATVHNRFLLRKAGPGGKMVRGAPTWKPQIVNSKRRLMEVSGRDPLFSSKHFRWAEGYIATYGHAEIHFLSTDVTANVEGATASDLLDIDEAHKTNRESYEEKFQPMTASTNAPTMLWGVAAAKRDVLYQERIRNFETGRSHRNIQITARELSKYDEQYAAHYEARLERLGSAHPVILTQYDMVDVESQGGAFKPEHIKSLLDSEHVREKEPRRFEGCEIIMVIDLAGEEEEKEDFDESYSDSHDPDSVCIFVVRVDRRRRVMDKPMCEIIDAMIYTGEKIQAAGPDDPPGVQEKIMRAMIDWQPRTVLIDSRGLGAPTASWIKRMWHREVIAYAATLPTVSEDIYSLYSYLHLGQLKFFRDDGSDEYRMFPQQLSNARIKFSGDLVNIHKPNRAAKIDMAKALTYIPRAVETVSSASAWGFQMRL